MPTQRVTVIGVIIAFAILAIFAFIRQQQAATNEAAAVAQANMGATAQADAQHNQATAVAQSNAGATAQVNAESAQSSAVAQANTQATAQSEAESAQASAVAQANAAMTAQAEAESGQGQAEATRAAAVESAQSAATAVQNQAATATVALGQAMLQAEIAQTAVSISLDSATQVSAQQQSSEATGTAIQGQNVAIQQTATVEAGELGATQTALVQMAGTLQAPLTPVAKINQSPQDTMQFLVDNQAIDGFGGRVAAHLATNIDLNAYDTVTQSEEFSGNYTDFVVSADMAWGGGAEEDQCGFILRARDSEYYAIVFNRYGHLTLLLYQDGEWTDFTHNTSSAMHIGTHDANHVVVVVQQDQFRIYVNDQPAASYVDSTLSQGQVMVLASTFGHSAEAGCDFKNAWVWSLENAAPTVTPIQPTATPAVPTATPGQPTVAPSMLSAYFVPELNQTFTYSNQSFSLTYPETWIVNELRNNTVSLSSSSRTSALIGGNAPDEILMNVATTSQISLEGMSLNALLDSIIGNVTDTSDPNYDPAIDFGEPELFQLGQHEALRAVGRSQHFDVEIVVFGVNNGVVLVYALCGAGNIKRCEPTVYAIAETVIYKFNPDASQNGFWSIK